MKKEKKNIEQLRTTVGEGRYAVELGQLVKAGPANFDTKAPKQSGRSATNNGAPPFPLSSPSEKGKTVLPK